MKTLNENFKVTNSELQTLEEMFKSGITLYRKVKLYGAGHPQLPNFFGTKFKEEESIEFWEDHETTHAKFIPYNSIEDIMNDKDFWRSDVATEGCELSEFDFNIYQ